MKTTNNESSSAALVPLLHYTQHLNLFKPLDQSPKYNGQCTFGKPNPYFKTGDTNPLTPIGSNNGLTEQEFRDQIKSYFPPLHPVVV